MANDTVGGDPRPINVSWLPDHLMAVLTETLLGMEAWLEAQRVQGGYGGGVVHWWRDCLDYTAAGLDWRYEGIIIGYLNLWVWNGDVTWLDKARRAGDDLLVGQIPSGNFRNSCFEANPNTGGTPGEAACDLALLRLAAALRNADYPDWQKYASAAERNLRTFFIDFLWDGQMRAFRDSPAQPSFVPNKAATLCEALFAMTELSGDQGWAKQYALPTLEKILDHQVQAGALSGAIYQNSFADRKVEKFFPFYIARCIPGLLAGHAYSGAPRFVQTALRAAEFVRRTRFPDGSYPQVIYPNGRINRYPQWIAGVGDILRALDLACAYGFEYDPQPSLDWLLTGRQADGSLRTAFGFGKATPGGIIDEDPRDSMPVVGWIDKAFRYLTTLLLGYGSTPKALSA